MNENGMNFGGYGWMPGFNNQPMMYPNGNIPTPTNESSLTDEEAKMLYGMRPSHALNLSISDIDVKKGMCNHKENGHDLVQVLSDGTGDVYCPRCQERWSQNPVTKEEVQTIVDNLITQMQNVKWVGDLPMNVTREYFSIIPMLKKFPEIFDFAMKNFEKFLGARGFYNAGDASVYGMYDALAHGAGAYPYYNYNFNGGGFNGYNGGYNPMAQTPMQTNGAAQPATPQMSPNINPMAPGMMPNGYNGYNGGYNMAPWMNMVQPNNGGMMQQPMGQPMYNGMPQNPYYVTNAGQQPAGAPVFNPAAAQASATPGTAPASQAPASDKKETTEKKSYEL